ncbi:MAG: polysaccharide deacetylase family protein [Victivallaceae bacterium]|nr:polysaccharide deacetylase family protein [Victivallaceae bacterium]
MNKNKRLKICKWLGDAPCAYSMTYDEGFIDVLANAYPLHVKYGIPGHLDAVAGQLGMRRNCFRSSMNGIFHMGVEHLKFLIGEGWSVGNHSYSHFCWPDQPGLDLYREVVYSKYLLEDLLGCPVTLFTIPNGMYNYEPALPYIKQAGYLGCHAVDGGVNYDDVDLLKIGNFMVATGPIRPRLGWPEKLLTENITFDDIKDGWLCETTHLVMPNVIQPWKNITPEDLEKRFVRLTEITGNRMWAAVPEDVIDYILMRRNTEIKEGEEGVFKIIPKAPPGLRRRVLSFKLKSEATKIMVDGRELAAAKSDAGELIFTLENLFKETTVNINQGLAV